MCTVREYSLVCQVWLPVTFKLGKETSKQVLYICRKVQVIDFSKTACIDVSRLPPYFPKPMTSPLSVTCDAVDPDIQRHNIHPLQINISSFILRPPPIHQLVRTQKFFKMWCVKHRLSSVAYLQSNGQTELVVKTAKRIVNETQASRVPWIMMMLPGSSCSIKTP